MQNESRQAVQQRDFAIDRVTWLSEPEHQADPSLAPRRWPAVKRSPVRRTVVQVEEQESSPTTPATHAPYVAQDPVPAERLPGRQPAKPEKIPEKKPKERVTLHVQDVDIRKVLEMLSRSYSLNILVAPDVSGTVTANIEDVELDVAINAVLKLCNLVGRTEDGLLYVYTAGKLPKGDLELRVFPVDYASAQDLMNTVTGLLSESGQAFVSQVSPTDNRRTVDTIVVTDTPRSLQRIAAYIAQMDVPPRQVMIEAYILEVELDNDFRHGINYHHLFSGDFELDVTGFADAMATPGLFARIKGSQVDAIVEWLQTTRDAKTLASPKVMVVNGQLARIQVGEQIGFKVTTVTETAAVEDVRFLDVGVVLEVTPQITRDGRVLMRVKPEVSSGAINPDTLLPEEDTRELETDVLLRDGQGVVIGGLIQERDIEIRKKVPVLGDLHFVGKAFRRTELEKRRSEIVVALVPRIVKLQEPVLAKDAYDAERAQMPLFHGPLCRLPRPEPRFSTPVEHPLHLFRSSCSGCSEDDCDCQKGDE